MKLLTTERRRRLVLFGGLGLVAVVNLADLRGVLRLGVMTPTYAWVGIGWVGGYCLLLVQEEGQAASRFYDLARLSLGFGLLVALQAATNPDMGAHYWTHATLSGQIVLVGGPMVWIATPVVGLAAGIDWFKVYWRLRQTTPEERVLGERLV